MKKNVLFYNKYNVFLDSFDDTTPIIFDKKNIPIPISSADSLHYHNRLEIGICCEGVGLFYNSSKSEVINKGDIIFCFPGSAHYSQSLNLNAPCLCRFIFIDSQQLLFNLFKERKTGTSFLLEAQSYNIPLVIRNNEFPYIHSILLNLVNDILYNQEETLLLSALHLSELLIKIPLYFPRKNISSENKIQRTDDSIYLTEAFIVAHYNEAISVEQLCQICNLSASQLRRRFKKIFGISPMKYMHRLRCNVSSQLLLHTSLSISEISQKIGYLDNSEFYKHFISTFEMAPTAFKKESQSHGGKII